MAAGGSARRGAPVGPAVPPLPTPRDLGRQLARIEVDVRHLDGAAKYLNALLQPLKEAQASARMAEEVALTMGGRGGSAFGAQPVGGVGELHRRMAGTLVEFNRNQTNLGTGIGGTARAMTGIANDYRTVEQRNKLNATDILKRLKRH